MKVPDGGIDLASQSRHSAQADRFRELHQVDLRVGLQRQAIGITFAEDERRAAATDAGLEPRSQG